MRLVPTSRRGGVITPSKAWRLLLIRPWSKNLLNAMNTAGGNGPRKRFPLLSKHCLDSTYARRWLGMVVRYIEASTGRESDEVMFLHVTGPELSMVEKAKALCGDLLANVKEQYEEFKSRPPRNHDRAGGFGDRGFGDRTGHLPPERIPPLQSTLRSLRIRSTMVPALTLIPTLMLPMEGIKPTCSTINNGSQHRPVNKVPQAHLAPARLRHLHRRLARPRLHHLLHLRPRHPRLLRRRRDLATWWLQNSGKSRERSEHDPFRCFQNVMQLVGVNEAKWSVSKVLRLSRPSLVMQYPVQSFGLSQATRPVPIPASLAYTSQAVGTNPEPFVLSPIINLPPSFGSAYVGETFSCTLCANHDGLEPSTAAAKSIRDVRIEAEMKTPHAAGVVKLGLQAAAAAGEETLKGVDLDAGQTLQKIVEFDLKEEGSHVLAVTVSYYEVTDISGRTRTFRKLYQFICKPSLIVRTKPSLVPSTGRRTMQWVLEAQLENCGDDAIQLDRVALDVDPGFVCRDCNWEAGGTRKPVLHPGEVEQVSFEVARFSRDVAVLPRDQDGKIPLGVLGVGWHSELGNRGFLSTGKLGLKILPT
ncbi:hypothetical protein P8C59_005311 [Phyllachora maydis]|uniref:Uncharacterized protein n=1 Tax=Phyllachora maydis TaxID=1825666 RepID=A0AAD9MDC8_9PEZI|nr:hypothetical protein P8C59_005311 [Phyllachora maydis]